MKFCKRCFKYLEGIIIPVVIITIAATLAIWTGVKSLATINDMVLNYKIARNNNLHNAYYFAHVFTPTGLSGGSQQDAMESIAALLNEDKDIGRVFTVRVSNDVEFERGSAGYAFTILIYDNDLDKAFPGLKSLGIDFSKYPEGGILASKVFNSVRTGKTLEAKFYPEGDMKKIQVAGHMRYPYKFMSFTGGGNVLSVSDMFSSGTVVIMRDTETTRKLITKSFYCPDLLFEVKDSMTEEKLSTLLSELGEKGTIESFDSMIERYSDEIGMLIKQGCPRPLFFMFSSLIGYVSIMVILIKSKEKETAVAFLCGSTKFGCIANVVGTSCLAALLPAMITTLMILIAPELEWRGIIVSDGGVITSDLIWMVVAYYFVTVIVSVFAIMLSMGRKSPLQYLRGLE